MTRDDRLARFLASRPPGPTGGNPTAAERARAFAYYCQIKRRPVPISRVDGISFGRAHFCVRVALRVAHTESDLFGLPRFDGDVEPRIDETTFGWIARVSAAIEAHRVAVEARGQVEKREERVG